MKDYACTMLKAHSDVCYEPFILHLIRYANKEENVKTVLNAKKVCCISKCPWRIFLLCMSRRCLVYLCSVGTVCVIFAFAAWLAERLINLPTWAVAKRQAPCSYIWTATGAWNRAARHSFEYLIWKRVNNLSISFVHSNEFNCTNR